jgi:uncharacterized membrane protein
MDALYVVVPAVLLLIGILTAWFSIRRMASRRQVAERIVLGLVVLGAVAVVGNSTYNAIAIQVFLAAAGTGWQSIART